MFVATNNINFESQNLDSWYYETCRYSTRATIAYVKVCHTKGEKLWIWMEKKHTYLLISLSHPEIIEYLYTYCVRKWTSWHIAFMLWQTSTCKDFPCTNLVDEKDLHSFKFFLSVGAVCPILQGRKVCI
jgi:hypothetical protein